MIFNTFAYFLMFLLPAAFCFRIARPKVRPWICVLFGAGFFVYFSVEALQLSPWVAALCLLIFVWESLFSRLYALGSKLCFAGVLLSLVILFCFKYWNFATGLATASMSTKPFH